MKRQPVIKAMNKTIPTDQNIEDFLSSIGDPAQREDSRVLVGLMSKIAGEQPVMWGASIIGFGKLRYKYASGRVGEWMRIGFSPRKDSLTLYLMCDTSKIAPELATIGKHKTGKGCVYIKRLADVSLNNLANLIHKAYSEAKTHRP